MSGHSKWASIKHKKGAADAKRGKIFTRLIKELTVAARAGGGDPDMNPRLRTIIADAKQNNMPAENIKRAIRRGTGEEPGVSYEEVMYEGYGPGGAAMIIDVLTDNKNRAVGEIRHILTKHAGNLAETNAVAWMFTKRGYIVVQKSKIKRMRKNIHTINDKAATTTSASHNPCWKSLVPRVVCVKRRGLGSTQSTPSPS